MSPRTFQGIEQHTNHPILVACKYHMLLHGNPAVQRDWWQDVPHRLHVSVMMSCIQALSTVSNLLADSSFLVQALCTTMWSLRRRRQRRVSSWKEA